MKILKDHGVKARWYVLGEGELREKLQSQINRLGLQEDFVLLGAKTNPYPYYRQCNMYVHATRFEVYDPCVGQQRKQGAGHSGRRRNDVQSDSGGSQQKHRRTAEKSTEMQRAWTESLC